MFEHKLEPVNRMDMSCFGLIVDWQGELSFVYDNGYETHYFTCDALTELARLFDNEEFCKFNESYDRCVDKFRAYGEEYTRLVNAKDNRFYEYINAIDDFERIVAEREQALVLRHIAHNAWVKSCGNFLADEEINFDLVCEIGARMMHVDKDMLLMYT